MTIEDIIDLQEAGSRARILGLAATESPFIDLHDIKSNSESNPNDLLGKHDHWHFGWAIENASRDESVHRSFSELALSLKHSRIAAQSASGN